MFGAVRADEAAEAPRTARASGGTAPSAEETIAETPRPKRRLDADSAGKPTQEAKPRELADQRRRLMKKQAPPQWYWDDWEQRTPQEPAHYLHLKRARQLYGNRYARQLRAGNDGERGDYAAKRVEGCRKFKDLPKGQQAYWLNRASEDGAAPDLHAADAQPSLVSRADGKAAQEARRTQFLLTWNGDWGLDNPSVQEAVRAEGKNPHALAKALAQQRCLQELMDSFWTVVAATAKKLGLIHVSVALELSTRAERDGRLHLHAFVSHPCKRLRFSAIGREMRFGGKAPSHISTSERGGSGRQWAHAAEGHYYLQTRKVGSVLRRTNHVKGLDFEISAKWVRRLWRKRKLSHEDALLEAIESRDRAANLVEEIRQVQRLETEVASKEKAAMALQTFQLRPFKPPTEAELLWLKQYGWGGTAPGRSGEGVRAATPISSGGGTAPENVVDVAAGGTAPLRRYKLLVYDGPSRTGKSERAQRWFGEAATLSLNCQGVTAPCLHEWLSGRYKAILCDEGDWKLVWGNRLLFQAGPRPVLLGQSNCNEHTYTVYVRGAPMMLTSNAFWAGCPKGGPEEEWLMNNIVYCYIAEPTWVQ